MNAKLILLGVILLIIILLGCMFITNEGFGNICDITFPTAACSHKTCDDNTNAGPCKTAGCIWDGDKCTDACESLRYDLCNNNETCKWEGGACIKLPDEEQDCQSKMEITDDDGKNIGTHTIRNVCPSDPKCVEICIKDHTWITTGDQKNTGTGTQKHGALKNEASDHLIVSSRCMECIKNFSPIIKLIHKNECNKT
jgi:hypothetical protein